MSRVWLAVVATAEMALIGTAGVAGTGHASQPIVDCLFTATAAGNGQPIESSTFGSVDGTLQTGQVIDLFNTKITHNNVLYWQSKGFGAAGDWYPIKATDTGVIYMAENLDSCTVDNG